MPVLNRNKKNVDLKTSGFVGIFDPFRLQLNDMLDDEKEKKKKRKEMKLFERRKSTI